MSAAIDGRADIVERLGAVGLVVGPPGGPPQLLADLGPLRPSLAVVAVEGLLDDPLPDELIESLVDVDDLCAFVEIRLDRSGLRGGSSEVVT